MHIILTQLICDLIGDAQSFIDVILMSIVPVTMNGENYMGTLLGTDWFHIVYDVFFGFGISVIVLKFLMKGFNTYIGWMDGNPDTDPLELLTHFFRAIAVAICFPVMYTWLVVIVTDLTDKLLATVGGSMELNFALVLTAISTRGLLTSLFALIFFIFFFVLYIQFLGRGMEILILRVGMPLACIGLLDTDKGVFGTYIKKFFQSMLAVVIQITLLKIGIGLMMNLHMLWAIAALLLAMRTPKFLQEFVLPYGGGIGMNTVYHTSRLFQMVKDVAKAASKGG